MVQLFQAMLKHTHFFSKPFPQVSEFEARVFFFRHQLLLATNLFL